MDIDDMKVGDVMTAGIETVAPDESLQEAAERMRARSVGMLLVMRGGEALGVVTDRDITVRATALGCDPVRTPVRDAMTPQVFSCAVDSDIEEAARIMEERAVRRVVVRGTDGRPAGIISVDDIAARVRDEELAGEVVRRAAEPGPNGP